MINIENVEVMGWEHVIRGMRNPLNSWKKGDSFYWSSDKDGIEKAWLGEVGEPMRNNIDNTSYYLGPNDHELMLKLAKAGTDHSKYRRMITVYLDITAPLYWWKEFDTYKVGTVANSCSTMHKIAEKEFTLDDFSCEHLITGFEEPDTDACIRFIDQDDNECNFDVYPKDIMCNVINILNVCRERYLETKDKLYWWQMIQLLPSSYNQRRTIMLNYEVLANMYRSRKNHKLDEWRDFCEWVESLPYSEIITGKRD